MTRLDLSGQAWPARMHADRPHSYTRLWSSRVVLSQTVQCHELLVSCLHVKGGCNGLLYYGDPYIGEHLGRRAYIPRARRANETWMQEHERPWPLLIPIVHLRSPLILPVPNNPVSTVTIKRSFPLLPCEICRLAEVE